MQGEKVASTRTKAEMGVTGENTISVIGKPLKIIDTRGRKRADCQKKGAS